MLFHVSSTVYVYESRQKEMEARKGEAPELFPQRAAGASLCPVHFVHFKPAGQHGGIIHHSGTDSVHRPPQQQMAPLD